MVSVPAKSRCLLFAALMLILPALAISAPTPPDFVELAENLKPSVVNISSSKAAEDTQRTPQLPGPQGPGRDMFEEFFEHFFRGMPEASPQPQRSLGSGFIISKDGFILTNNHVIEGADEVKVRLADGRTFDAEIRGLDPKLDLGLLKIETDEDLPVAQMGDSDALRVGEWVMAIGNPFGLNQTVTVGIVSAKGRVIGAGPYDDFIQTDASINPGNSGGPLFNAEGKVVGINTAIIAGGQGIGFATPINAAQKVLPQLQEKGHVVRGFLGVSIQMVSKELAESFGLDEPKGALVARVFDDSPAEKAGIQRGDIILAFNGQEIEDMSDLPRLVAATPVGEEANVTIFRDGKTRQVSVEVEKMPEEPRQTARNGEGDDGEEKLGLVVSNLTPEAVQAFNLKADQGVVVARIDPAGPAAMANLRPGDVIVEINGRSIENVSDLRDIVQKSKQGRMLRLLVQRGENHFYTTLEVR